VAGGVDADRATTAGTQHDDARQRDALEAAGVDRICVDHTGGASESRPALDEMPGQWRPGDTVVLGRLDRLGRSRCQLIDRVGALSGEEPGCGA